MLKNLYHPTVKATVVFLKFGLRINEITLSETLQNHPAYQPASHLMAIAGKASSEEIIKLALDDWCLPAQKNYTAFAKKHSLNSELQLQDEKLDAIHRWCDGSQVQATPTFYLNGKQLPDAYHLIDIPYFLLE